MSAEIGRVLGGRYRLVAPIGLGASAQVFLADDVRLRRRVALKMLHEALADDAEFLRRFRAEAQAAAALSHPNVMAVYDWGDDEIAFIVTEYLGGGSLRALLDHGGVLTPSQALTVGLEAARALDYAHRRGFVHRDIKPANLLFGEEQRLRIADFGLARALAEAAWTEPQGAMLGTARYASPEQAKGEKLSGKADVYSLALVLVEAVTGEVPFTADTTLGTLMARVDRQLEVPEALGPLQRVLLRAGHPDPEQRIDARTLAAGLLRAAKALPRPQPLPLAGALPPAGLLSADDDPTIHAPVIVKDAEPDLTEEDLDLVPPDWVNQPEGGIDPEPVAERVVVAPLAGEDAEAEAPADPGPSAPAPDDEPDEPAEPAASVRVIDPVVAAGAAGAVAGDPAGAGVTDPTVVTAVGESVRVIAPAGSAPAPATAAATTSLASSTGTAEHAAIEVDLDADEPRRRRRWPWVALIVLLLLGSAGTAYAVVANREDDPPPTRPALVLPVPDVAGLSQAKAEEVLENAGWTTTAKGKRQNDSVKGEILSLSPAPGTRLPRNRSIELIVSAGQEMVTLPDDVRGRPLDEVQALLGEVGITGEVVARTHDEDVGADGILGYADGTKDRLERGATVGLVASDGPRPRTVPNVKGSSEDEAEGLIDGQQLKVAITRSYSDEVDEGVVISQLPRSGTEVARGETVTIEVSRGPNLVKVPSVAKATTPAQAAQILRDAGLVPGSVSGSADGTPTTRPAAGTEVRRGTKVDIILR